MSASGQLAEKLRESILSGELRPGTPLREVELATAGGVSRTTARETLRILVNEGLVRHSPHRGAAVAMVGPADVADAYGVRRMVESFAIDASERCRRDDFDELAAALAVLAESGSHWQRQVDADLTFHMRIAELIGSPRITQMFRTVLDELRLGFLIVSAVDREFEDPTGLIDEHRRMLEMMRAGKRAECKRVLLAHLARYEARMIAILQERMPNPGLGGRE